MLKPGIYQMTAEEYHSLKLPTPALSNSIIKIIIEQSCLHAWAAHPQLNPNWAAEQEDDEEKFDIGTAAHALILEGVDKICEVDVIKLRQEEDARLNAKPPKKPYKQNWATNIAKAARETVRDKGMIPLLPAETRAVRSMVKEAHKAIAGCSNLCGMTIEDFNPEKTLIWCEEFVDEHGEVIEIWCKARIDLLCKSNLIMLDLKSTGASAEPRASARRILDGMLGYIQAAWYRRGLMAITKIDAPFIFLNQEWNSPYACSLIKTPDDYLKLGEDKIRVAMAKWAKCISTNTWPAYDLHLYEPELKTYLLNQWYEQVNQEAEEEENAD